MCEINDVDGIRIVVHKHDNNLFYIEDSELRFNCELLQNGTMQWDKDIEQSVHDKYLVLMTGR